MLQKTHTTNDAMTTELSEHKFLADFKYQPAIPEGEVELKTTTTVANLCLRWRKFQTVLLAASQEAKR